MMAQTAAQTAGTAAAPRPVPTVKTGRGLGRAPALLARAFSSNPTTVVWDKDDLADALFWLRVVGGLAAGAAYGLGGVTGGPPALGFVAAAVAGGLAWARAAGVEDDEAYGGLNALLTEGMGPAFALFLLVWIMLHTAKTVGV